MSGDLKCSACGYVRNGYHWCKGELRDNREQARLARIREQSRQLSLEECVYWLEVLRISAINWTVRDWSHGAIVCAILRDAPGVSYWSRLGRANVVFGQTQEGIGGGYPSKHSRERREAIVLSVLCREARRRIRELQR